MAGLLIMAIILWGECWRRRRGDRIRLLLTDTGARPVIVDAMRCHAMGCAVR